MIRHLRAPIFFLAIVGLCFAGMAQAATRATSCDPVTPDNAICVTITPATLDVTGQPLPAGPTFRLEQKTGTGSFVQIATGLTSPQFYVKNLAPGDYVFRSYQNCVSVPNVYNCIESGATAPSSPRTVTVPTIQPATPVIIIAVTIRADGPPIYRIIQSVNLKQNEVILVAPASMRPIFASR